MFPPGYEPRLPTPADAEALARSMVRNRDHLAPWDPARDDDYFTTKRQRASLEHLGQDSGRETWLLLHGTEVVGALHLNQIVRGHLQSAVLGYWVDLGHTRRGLATGLAAYGIERATEMGLHRLEAGTHVDNIASQGVLRAAGFEEYGIARGLLFLPGGWSDHVLFQRLLHDDPPPA